MADGEQHERWSLWRPVQFLLGTISPKPLQQASFQHAAFSVVNRPLWHGLCFSARIMTQDRAPFAAYIAIGFILICSHQILAQPSTAPPSSLSTRPGELESKLRPSCDLCRKPAPQAGSTIHPHRLHREKWLHPHKRRNGLRRSPSRSFQSLLRRQTFARLGGTEHTVDGRQIYVVDGDTFRYGAERVRLKGIDTPELSEPGGPAAKLRLEELLHNGPVHIVPHGRDVYNRLVADVFVDGQNVAERLNQEGHAKPVRSTP